MYQPVHLESFLRLLVAHFGRVIDEGERLGEHYSSQSCLEALLAAIDGGDPHALERCRHNRLEYEALFVLQMSQAREWVEQLGRLDPVVERDTDEFLVSTLVIESLLQDRQDHLRDYQRVNRLIAGDGGQMLKADLRAHIDIDAMLCAIFELLGRLEEQYCLMGDLLEEDDFADLMPMVVYPVAEATPSQPAASAKAAATGGRVIPLFPDAGRKNRGAAGKPAGAMAEKKSKRRTPG